MKRIEGCKVWKHQMFVKLLLLLLLLAFGLKWYQMQYIEAYPPSAYTKLADEIKQLDEDAKNQFFIDALTQSETSTEPTYTDTTSLDTAFLKEQYAEFQLIHRYDQMREAIEQQALQMQTSPLFQKHPDTIATILKTAKDYAQIEFTDLTFHVDKGFTVAWQDPIPFMMSLLMLFPLVYVLFFEECETHLLYLMKSTPKGRGHTIVAKLIVLSISTLLILLLFYGESWLFSMWFYPILPGANPLQSIVYFLSSTLTITINEYLLLFLMSKWMMCYIVALIFVFLLFKTQRMLHSICILLLLFLLEYAGYMLFLATGRFFILKYVNIYTWLDVHFLFASYHNVVLFHHVFSLPNISFVIATSMLLLLILINIHHFLTHKEIYEQKQRSLLQLPFHPHSLSYYNLYKVLWSQKTIFLFLAFFYFLVQSVQVPTLSSQQLYQKAYIEELQLVKIEERAQYLQDKQQYFMSLQDKIAQINEQQKQGAYSKAEASTLNANMEMQLRAYPAFMAVKQQYEVGEQQGRTILLFEDGYLRLFQVEHVDVLLAILCVLLLCIPPAVFMDKQPSIRVLMGSLPLGKQRSKQNLWQLYCLLAMLMGISYFIKDLYEIAVSFGLPSITSPLSTLSYYEQVHMSISIGMFYVLGCCLRMYIIISFAYLIYTVSLRLTKITYVYLIAAGCIFGGAILQLFGFSVGGFNIFTLYQLPFANTFSWWLLYPGFLILMIKTHTRWRAKKNHGSGQLAFLEKIRYTNSKRGVG